MKTVRKAKQYLKTDAGQRLRFQKGVIMVIDTKNSPYAKAYAPEGNDVALEEGFWLERTKKCMEVTIPHVFSQFTGGGYFHEEENFKIAAGELEGEFFGTPYGDGDMYKLMEGAMIKAAKYGDAETDRLLDEYIALIGRAQCADGYISTKQIIGEMKNNGVTRQGDIDDFEVYNFGHLFTAACMHKRLTGKDNFMKIAVRAADYLDQMYHEAARTGTVQTAVCPSHYMGLVELYRTTGEEKYLELAKLAIDLRDQVKNGTDDNQDRLPLREHKKILGHAVRSTYLYAGAADLYLENGDGTLLPVLDRVWENLVDKKLYITGGCGALYSGMSPYGMFLEDQRVHQAFGYEYQLPNVTAYNETCATLGNIFWNYRMFAIEPKAVYFDIIERSMLNLALGAVSLDGDKYFYENMLRRTKKLDYELIWPLERAHLMGCFCCPTNLSRVIMEAYEYLYMQDEDSVYLGMYGASKAKFALKNGAAFTLKQETEYPWDGAIRITFEDAENSKPFSVKVRVPGWLSEGSILAAGKTVTLTQKDANRFVEVRIEDAAHTELLIDFAMPVRLTTAHALVEEAVNQAAVECGPLVYCIESPDAEVETIDDLLLPTDAEFEKKTYEILGTEVTALYTDAAVLNRTAGNRSDLYRPLQYDGMKQVPVRFIPYFAWDNRGYGEMRIWMPLLYK